MNRASQNKQEIAEAYASLDLAPGADLAQVKAAYRRLAQALHPDHNPGAVGTLMARVNQAYATLLTYLGDQPAPAAPFVPFAQAAPAAPSTGVTPYIYENFAAPTSARASRPRATVADQADSAPLAAFTRHHDLDFPWAACSTRSARAEASSGWRLVGLTRQADVILYRVEISGQPESLTLPVPSHEPCASCGGSGLMGHGTCPACGGRGHLVRPRQVRLNLPRSWRPGQRLSLGATAGREPLEVELRPAPGGRF